MSIYFQFNLYILTPCSLQACFIYLPFCGQSSVANIDVEVPKLSILVSALKNRIDKVGRLAGCPRFMLMALCACL
jgi:hypothetical protein